MAAQPVTDLHALIDAYLERMELEPHASEDGLYMLRYGSTAVVIRTLRDSETGKRFVRFSAATLIDFEPSELLLEEVLRLNNEVLFGSFKVFPDNTLSFSATIYGDHMDFEEFETALTYVIRISDEYDDILQALAGGDRASDLLGR
ncbi:MAG: YbjN domain-containing protein [Myxococcota bacterium]|nr:YbjN domain-containing protein [Myxococcota bacterium]